MDDAADRHWLDPSISPEDTMIWLERTGYEFEPDPGHQMDMLTFVREGRRPVVALIGQTLAWDGHTLTVEEY